MEKLFLIPQQGAVFLTLLGVGIGLGAWWQLLSWVRRRMPGLGTLWDGLFAMSLGASLLGVYGSWQSVDGVRHLIAQRLVDLSELLGDLNTQSRNFH